MHCYICFESIHKSITWGNFLSPTIQTICSTCEEKFEKLTSKKYLCEKCMKPLEERQAFCGDCLAWEERLTIDPLKKNVSIFTYNDYMKDVMAKFKYRGDYEIILAFEKQVQITFKTMFSKQKLTIIPIPLSPERYKERRFNQAEAIAALLNKPIINALTRIHSEKQAKKTKAERVFSENPFQIATDKPIKKALIIDDLYTTGTTLRQAAQRLEKFGVKEIYSFTLIRS
ncbi:ComF family protein [Bacillaceae bacterium W0354]